MHERYQNKHENLRSILKLLNCPLCKLNAQGGTETLQTLFASRLDWEAAHGKESTEDHGSGCKNWRVWIGLARVYSHDRSTKPTDAVETRGDACPRASIWSREDLGRVGIQDAIHDIYSVLILLFRHKSGETYFERRLPGY